MKTIRPIKIGTWTIELQLAELSCRKRVQAQPLAATSRAGVVQKRKGAKPASQTSGDRGFSARRRARNCENYIVTRNRHSFCVRDKVEFL